MVMMRICRRMVETASMRRRRRSVTSSPSPSSSPSSSSSFHTDISRHRRAASTIPRYHIDFSQIQKVSDAVFLFDDMLRMRPRPSLLLFSEMLKLAVEIEDYSLALHMFDNMRQCSFAYNDYTLNIVINCYSLLNRVDLAFSIFSMFFKSGLVPDVTTFNTLIRGLFLNGKVTDAVLLYKKLLRENLCEPDEVTLTTVIDCYCLMNRVDFGFSVFGMFIKYGLAPNVITFSTLVKGLFLNEKGVDAVLLFTKLSRENLCEPDEVTFNTVIDGLCKLGKEDYSLARRMFDEMRQCSFAYNDYTLNIAINCYCLLNRVDLAFSGLGIFLKSGFVPDVTTFNTLIKGLFLNGKVADAVLLYKKLSRENLCEPDEVTFSTVIDGLCKFGKDDYSLALHMFDEMHQCGVRYNDYTLSIVINCYCLLNRVDLGFSIFGIFLKSGFVPDVTTFNTLIKGLFLNDKVTDGWNLFNEMQANDVIPDVVTYNTLMDRLCKDGKLAKAIDLFNKLPSKGLHPNVITFTTIISRFCQDGLLKEAKCMFVEMEKYGCTPDRITYYVILKGCLKSNELQKVEPVLQEIRRKGLSLEEAANVYLLLDYCVENGGDGVPLDMIKKLFQLN